MSSSYKFIVTAEHASAQIPNNLKLALQEYASNCETHQVYDPGTKSIAEEIAQRLNCPLVLGAYTRLAVDLNRSIGNPSQFSPIVSDLCESEKARLLTEIFIPFREESRRSIEGALHEDCTLVHLSIHSFTKVFQGVKREVDLGILFDDQRPAEAAFCKKLSKLLKIVYPELCIRFNEPYNGKEDGHTTALRKRYPENRYIGIEIEFSQDLDLELDAESYATILSKALKGVIR
ncbi:N-formylglutamate amidohydrolase [Pelagicoccus sp. SDUM812002]|uniref:N-formylglutamate amidohydrolase n=1 Tax=Pelagicoccus sp. SDUM812002 TaxID=3041266 RepID=UPI00280F2D17|nr:N-formylglutamate amidohydrolase [Pelagicoccus sp. SDUM812002]MDQ8184383.1 N-formylglutamate amidohydrolase [Pelagicoccus sp. SDUM812002]